MHNRALHAALHAFCLDCAALLGDDLKAGAEVAFELIDEGGSGPALYHYRARSEQFIAERWERLRELPSYSAASAAIERGAIAYARVRGLTEAGTDAVLHDVVDRLWEDASEFALPEERFERLYPEIEQRVGETTLVATVIVPVMGARLSSTRVELEPGVALVCESAIDELPDFLHHRTGDRDGERIFCEVRREQESDASLPIEEARAHFRRALCALRLIGAAGAQTGSLAWARAGEGEWSATAVGAAEPIDAEPWPLSHEDEDELRILNERITATSPVGRLAWALARFEMGCARTLDAQALSDHLLALRALLAGSHREAGHLALRTAALCAEEHDRAEHRRRVELALELEFALISGEPAPATEGLLPSSRQLVDEVEQYVRALLRDVLCGYLEEDLPALADEILLAAGGGGEVRVTDARSAGSPTARAVHVPAASEAQELAPTPAAADSEDPLSAVTPSDDWEPAATQADDADCFAGPI